ncbi:MAG: hypothetical protein GY791_16220 [Alphaproteobacteria bacterium]|nr:hypothetical protein [Alphaproteobacteria bacterium]
MAGAATAVSLLVLTGPAVGQMQCRGGTIDFFPDGAIRSCEIEAVHEVHVETGWIKCAHSQTMIRHANGKLQSCTLFEAAHFDGVICPADARITFDEDGNLRHCD